MVELLRREGNTSGVLRLETLWTELVESHAVSLLCAYPLQGFAGEHDAALFADVCAEHADVVPGSGFDALTPLAQRRHVAELERRARGLAEEVELRQRVEAEHARVHAAERAARAEMALLYRVTDAANRAETLEDVYAAALDGIAAALGPERAAILRFDADGVLRFEAWRGLSDAYRSAVEGHSPWRPDTMDPAPVLVEDVRADPALAPLRPALAREGIGALGFFPLATGGRLLGKFMVYYPGRHAFTERERRLAGAIADQVAFAVDRTLASLERERFLGIVGHDLRNPLNAITVTAGLLLRGEDPGRLAAGARRILTSAGRMERLISQVLDLAKARHGGGLPIRRAAADLAEVARHAVEELAAAHPDRRFRFAAEGETRAELDADRVAEVFSNLVGNAVQHGGDGPIEVSVRGEAAELLAEIQNGGAPIPPAALPALFDPFRRGPGGGDRPGSVGLGLFISREIVRAHGGRIEVRSGEAGTTFVVRLPRATAEVAGRTAVR
jgi:signal transduction histidine kinase